MSQTLNGKKILIVDDEPDVFETLNELLDGDGRRSALRGQLFNCFGDPIDHDPHDGLTQNIYRGAIFFGGHQP